VLQLTGLDQATLRRLRQQGTDSNADVGTSAEGAWHQRVVTGGQPTP
jgi:hypothetical protein